MSSNDISAEELQNIQVKKKAYEEALEKGSAKMQDLAREYHDAVINAILSGDLPIEPGCGADPDPTGQHIKPGGWGGDTASPTKWDAVPMKDNPNEWKIIDTEGKNIAHKFASEEEAEKYIKYHRCMQEKGDLDPPPEPKPPSPGPAEPAEPEGPPVTKTGLTPYPAVGKPLASTQRGPTVRHYASGKADDKTVEKNVKAIPFENYQWVTYVTMNSIEHNDTISLKFGGQHMGKKGWYDCGVGFDGQTCAGTEPKHPSTKLCIIKGPNIGSILNKKIGVAGIFFKQENKIELWTDFPAGSGWKKQIEGVSVGGLKPDPSDNETQLRIDGFEDLPTIHEAFVTEINKKAK